MAASSILFRPEAGYTRPTGVNVIDGKGPFGSAWPSSDAHGHVLGLGFSALQLDLVGTSSLDDLKQRLARLCRCASRCALDHRRGWNQELWPASNSRRRRPRFRRQRSAVVLERSTATLSSSTARR
jgi:predicted amidohydrolase YtcJ